jgi:hypothetical protein
MDSYSFNFGKEQIRLFLLGDNCSCRQFAVRTVLHRYAHSSGDTHYDGSSKLGFTSTNHNPYICMAQMSIRNDYHNGLQIWLLPQVSDLSSGPPTIFVNTYQRLFAQG